MRFQLGNTSIRFGKPPFPRSEDRDALSRLALAYRVRRDIHEVAGAVETRIDLPSDGATSKAIVQVIAAVINAGINDPHATDRLAAGKGIPQWAKESAMRTTGRALRSAA